MYSVGEMVLIISTLSLATFSVSSMWLFSPGFKKIRVWWDEHTGILAPLAYCQLCCSFWIALLLNPFIMDYGGIQITITLAIIAAGVSWMFGAITNCFLYVAAAAKLEIEDSRPPRMPLRGYDE